MGTRTNEVLHGRMSDDFTVHGDMCIGGGDDVRTFDSDPELLERIVRHCCEQGVRTVYDETLSDGSTAHSFARRISTNPVTGSMAVAIAVLSISDTA